MSEVKNIAVCDVCNVAQDVFEILVYVYNKLQHNLSLLGYYMLQSNTAVY